MSLGAYLSVNVLYSFPRVSQRETQSVETMEHGAMENGDRNTGATGK